MDTQKEISNTEQHNKLMRKLNEETINDLMDEIRELRRRNRVNEERQKDERSQAEEKLNLKQTEIEMLKKEIEERKNEIKQLKANADRTISYYENFIIDSQKNYTTKTTTEIIQEAQRNNVNLDPVSIFTIKELTHESEVYKILAEQIKAGVIRAAVRRNVENPRGITDIRLFPINRCPRCRKKTNIETTAEGDVFTELICLSCGKRFEVPKNQFTANIFEEK